MSSPHPSSPSDRSRVTVAVVGAGYSGLATALRLHDLGIDAVVLEASDRVGGRVLTEQRHGVVVDHGGQWVGPTQRHLLDLAARFGCATFPTWETGRHLEVWPDGSTTGAGPGLTAYDGVVAEIEDLARTVDPAAPWRTPDAAALDASSAAAFFRARTQDPAALARLALAVQGVWCAEPAEISMLHVLFYVHAAGGWAQLMETGGAAQDRRFADGAAAPARAVAAVLGDRVRLRTAVTAIASRPDGDGVQLTTGSGEVVIADRVVVAVPPPALASMRFDPALPPERRGWVDGNRMGRVAKVHAVYPTPFWRAEGRSGIASLFHDGAVGVVFDNSPADASRGVLVGFVYADRLDAWRALDAPARRAAVLADLALVVGDRALDPVDYTEKTWIEDPFARGGYEAFTTPGAWTGHGERGWRAPVGPIHWAGTETAEEWNGYIDGAISSGRRAAEEVAATLVARVG